MLRLNHEIQKKGTTKIQYDLIPVVPPMFPFRQFLYRSVQDTLSLLPTLPNPLLIGSEKTGLNAKTRMQEKLAFLE